MKINYELNENGVIVSWQSIPFSNEKPYIELDNPETIRPGIDKIIDGKLIQDTEAYNKVLEKAETLNKIARLKQKLADTDYMIIKCFEGELSQEDIADVSSQRKEWRKEINELEGEIK